MKAEKSLASHWNNIYENANIEQLGWYEENPEPSITLVKRCALPKEARILHVGAGASTLIDRQIQDGYSNLIVSDLSQVALQRLQQRLGEQSHQVNWIVDDLTRPHELNRIAEIDLWHDRAVLHFFNTEKERKTYFDLLRKLVKKGGFVIIASFNLEGAQKCSGLPVQRCNQNMIQHQLGESFELLEAFDYTYQMPSGNTRAYVYTLFQRKKA